jgi:hypothetical protein
LQSKNLPRRPKVVQITRAFVTRPPLIAGLEDEIVQRWINGALTLTLSKDYQTTREVIEWIIWRRVAPVMRAELARDRRAA